MNNFKITKSENKYFFHCVIENENIFLENICNFIFLKNIVEMPKNIFSDYSLDIYSDDYANIYILFKHFFEDFGYTQKYMNLDIKREKTENVIKYIVTPVKTNIHIEELIGTITFITPHKITITLLATFYDVEVPEFIETAIKSFVEKWFFTLKQYIDNLK